MVMTRDVQVGDTTPCETCGHVKSPAKRLHELACCGLEGHTVHLDYLIQELASVLGHRWRNEGTYAAVKSERDISEADALAWLERAHSGEVERRPYRLGEAIIFDVWAD